MRLRGVQKCKILDSELAVWVFPWFGVSETTKKNFSSLAYLECPPLMAFQYTKEIQKNTKEKSWNIIFQFFAQKTILLTFLRLPAAFLRSQRFFWHPYRHKWMFSCHRTLCVIYVIYGIYDTNDTLAFDIDHDLLRWYGCQKKRWDLRNAAGHPRIVRIISLRLKINIFYFEIFPLCFLEFPLYNKWPSAEGIPDRLESWNFCWWFLTYQIMGTSWGWAVPSSEPNG